MGATDGSLFFNKFNKGTNVKLSICENVLAELRNKLGLSDDEITYQIISMIQVARSKSKIPEHGHWRRKFPNTKIVLKIKAVPERYKMPPAVFVILPRWRSFADLEQTKKDLANQFFENTVLENA